MYGEAVAFLHRHNRASLILLALGLVTAVMVLV